MTFENTNTGRTLMCTSIAMKTNDFYFGRTMDLNQEFHTSVVITPRNYPIAFRRSSVLRRHNAIIGMAAVVENYPLYAEAANEKGLCMAALNFPDNADYSLTEDPRRTNVSPFELFHWILGQCDSVEEARQLLDSTHLIGIPFSEKISLTPQHWHIADRESSVTLENTPYGLELYNNPVGVLTNNPAFQFQLTNLCQYMNLISGYPKNCFSSLEGITPFGQGLGSFGLPGDYSPSSRFVKAAYLLLNSVCPNDDSSSLAQFIHLLDSVSIVRGSVLSQEEVCDTTTYACCINATRGIYYYKTYSNNQLTGIDLRHENLDSGTLRIFPLVVSQQIAWAN